MKQIVKKYILPLILVCCIIVSLVIPVPAASAAQVEKGAIQYNNNVFTKKLYKNTAKIKFCYTITKNKKVIKKVYALLAKMKLERKEPNPDEPKKVGFVSIIIYTKKNKTKRYSFQGDQMRTDSKRYSIIEDYPIDEIREIFQSL